MSVFTVFLIKYMQPWWALETSFEKNEQSYWPKTSEWPCMLNTVKEISSPRKVSARLMDWDDSDVLKPRPSAGMMVDWHTKVSTKLLRSVDSFCRSLLDRSVTLSVHTATFLPCEREQNMHFVMILRTNKSYFYFLSQQSIFSRLKIEMCVCESTSAPHRLILNWW